MDFWDRPRHVWWRRVLFQVHLWCGLTLGLYFVTVSLTGSIVVYKKELERLAIPELIHVQATGSRGSFADMVRLVTHTYPGYRLQNAYPYQEPGVSWSFRLQGQEGRVQVYVDPYRLRILGHDTLAAAMRTFPEAEARLFTFSSRPELPHSLHKMLPSDWRTQGDNVVYVDPQTADIVRADYHRDLPLGVRLQRDLYGLHFGTFWGHSTRVLWLLVGVAPVCLFVSGVLIWWNRSPSKALRRRRAHVRAPAREAPEPGGATAPALSTRRTSAHRT